MSSADRMTRIVSRFVPEHACSYASSAACGVWLLCWAHQALSGFGTSLRAQTAFVLVALTAVLFSVFLARRVTWKMNQSTEFPTGAVQLALHISLAATVFTGALQLETGWAVIERVCSTAAGATNVGPLPAIVEVPLLAIGIATAWLLPLVSLGLLLFIQTDEKPHSSSATGLSRRLCAASGAVVVAALLTGGTSGMLSAQQLAVSLSGITCGIVVSRLARKLHAPGNSPSLTQPSAEELPAPGTASESLAWSLFLFAIPLFGGSLFAAMSRLNDQLFLAASWMTALQWASLVITGLLAAGAATRHRLSTATMAATAAALAMAILLAWPLLVRGSLEVNSSVSSVTLAAAARIVTVFLCVAPVGILLAASQCCAKDALHGSGVSDSTCFLTTMTVTGFAAGWLIARWWALKSLGVPGIVAVSTIAALCASLARAWSKSRGTSASPGIQRSAFAASFMVIIAAPFLNQTYNPGLSAKLLFDTGVFVTHQYEERSDILPYLDEGRCLSTVEADHGTLTFWRYRGQQLQIRESGLPFATASRNTEICPQPSSEILQAVLPLVLHDRPSNLLLLGLRSGAVLQTSIAFPLERITCIEPDGTLLDAVSDQILSKATPNPLDDSRVSLNSGEPLLQLKRLDSSVDVIVAAPDHLGNPRAASMATAEFLRTGSSALRDGGIFCQPLDYVDAGPGALKIVFDTWQSVFADVTAVEIAPGKLLLTGTDSPAGIIRDGLISRLRKPNVRFALAQTGWDWSTPLRLAAYTHNGIKTALGDVTPEVSSVTSGRLTCALPWEIMRWGDKYSDVMNTFGQHAVTLKNLLGTDAFDPTVKARLAELEEQRSLIHDHPDEYWYYRRKVKERLTKKPQSELVHIKQVKGENPVHELHEEEKRRVDYFKALGHAARQKQPDADALLTVESYGFPYDPLVSLFMHQELAELAARDQNNNVELELRHRLHRIYFSSPSDKAVRNVVATLRLLIEHPEAMPSDVDRADQLDSLLQVLHDRWHNRGDSRPGSSKIVLNDIEKSIAAVEDTFTAMDELLESRGMTEKQWASRQVALEKSLLLPLRAYRSTLMPHHVQP